MKTTKTNKLRRASIMWPFGSGRSQSRQLPEEELKRIRRNCRSSLSAYAACSKSNKGIPLACDRLENKVVECLAAQCKECAEEVEHFRGCLQSISFNVESITGLECQKDIDAMRRCLKKLSVL